MPGRGFVPSCLFQVAVVSLILLSVILQFCHTPPLPYLLLMIFRCNDAEAEIAENEVEASGETREARANKAQQKWSQAKKAARILNVGRCPQDAGTAFLWPRNPRSLWVFGAIVGGLGGDEHASFRAEATDLHGVNIWCQLEFDFAEYSKHGDTTGTTSGTSAAGVGIVASPTSADRGWQCCGCGSHHVCC